MIVCIPDLLTTDEIGALRSLAARAAFVDGRETAGLRARRVKKNEQVARDATELRQFKEIVIGALQRNPDFKRTAIPHHIRPPLISRYRPGMAYGPHIDDALMGPTEARERSDLSVTVFLNDAADYEGGELRIHSPYGLKDIKLPAGHAVAYPSSTLHEVLPVRSGERLVAVTWVQSYIRDERRREILRDLLVVRNRLAALAPNAPETDLAYRIHTNLMRLWAET